MLSEEHSVLDVGAHIGCYTLITAYCIQKKKGIGLIFTFESRSVKFSQL